MSYSALRMLQRRYEGRAPIYRFPAARYDTLPEDLSYDGSNRCILLSDKSGNSAVNCLVLNGVAGNYASRVNAAAVQITGPIDLRACIGSPSWTTATNQMLISKLVTAGQYGYDFFVTATGGTLTFRYSPDGTAVRTAVSSAATGFAAFSINCVRVTYDSATGNVLFYTRSDTDISSHTGWTQLGTTQVLTAGTIFAGTDPVGIGANSAGTANMATCNYYRAQIYNGIAGTLAFDFDPSVAAKLAGTVTERSANAATVTINSTGATGATGARICGARDLYQGTAANQPVLTIAATGNYLTFDGSNDYLKSPAFALAQPVSIYMTMSQVSWTLNDVFFDGNATASVRTYQSATTPRIRSRAGATGSELDTFHVGTNGIITTVFSGAASLLRYNRTAALTGDFGTGSPNGFTLGANADGSAPSNITASSVLVFPAAHDEIAQQRVIRDEMRRNRIPMAA